MAAIVMAGVIGVLVGSAIGMWIERGGHRAAETLLQRKVWELEEMASTPAPARPLLSEELTAKLVERLLDASLPERRDTPEPEDRPGSPAEYEPPPPEVGDWSDPFIGVDRELVGGLRPGEGIPGIGADGGVDLGPDPYATAHDDTDDHLFMDRPEARGFEAVGDDLFETWDANRGEMPR